MGSHATLARSSSADATCTLAWAAALRNDPRYVRADAATLTNAVLDHIRSGGYTYSDLQESRQARRVTDSDLVQIPDIDADRTRYDIKWWTMAPGDCLVFHAMIVHGAQGNNTTCARRRGLSLRYTGDDARYDPRPGTFQFPHKPDLAAGAAMTCDLFPRAWPKTA